MAVSKRDRLNAMRMVVAYHEDDRETYHRIGRDYQSNDAFPAYAAAMTDVAANFAYLLATVTGQSVRDLVEGAIQKGFDLGLDPEAEDNGEVK